MAKTEIENKIYDLKRTVESCKNIIKSNENEIKKLEAEKEKPVFERLKSRNEYYFVHSTGGQFAVDSTPEEYTFFDDKYFESNNYFHTKERAEEVADKINFLLKLERLHDTFCPDYKPDWEDKSKAKWVVVFDCDKDKYTPFYNAFLDDSTIVYFDSGETADKVCKILNKEIENA